MKLSDKLIKCNDSLAINMYENGFMVEVTGRDHNDDWKTVKIVCNDLNEVFAVITDASKMPKD